VLQLLDRVQDVPPHGSTVEVDFVGQLVSALSGSNRSVLAVALDEELRGAPDRRSFTEAPSNAANRLLVFCLAG